MLVDLYAALAAASTASGCNDSAQNASEAVRIPSKLPALGLPYGPRKQRPFKRVTKRG